MNNKNNQSKAIIKHKVMNKITYKVPLITLAMTTGLLLASCEQKEVSEEANNEYVMDNSPVTVEEQQYIEEQVPQELEPNNNEPNENKHTTIQEEQDKEKEEKEKQEWYGTEGETIKGQINNEPKEEYSKSAQTVFNRVMKILTFETAIRNKGEQNTSELPNIGNSQKDENLKIPNVIPKVQNTDTKPTEVKPDKETIKVPKKGKEENKTPIKENNNKIDKPTPVTDKKILYPEYIKMEGNTEEEQLTEAFNRLEPKVRLVTTRDDIEDIIKQTLNKTSNVLLITKSDYIKMVDLGVQTYFIDTLYNTSKKQMVELNEYVQTVVTSLIGTTPKESIKEINRIISDLGEYDDTLPNIYSPFTLYNQGYGVCQAYTSLAQIMLDKLGITNSIATGELEGIPHTWNVVYLDGEELHIDFTLNDATDTEEYLLVSKETITKTHTLKKYGIKTEH